MELTPETVKDRLLLFLKDQRISKTEFARKMGLSVAYVSAMRKSLPEDKVVKMTELFPNSIATGFSTARGDANRASCPGRRQRLHDSAAPRRGIRR